MLQWKQAHVTSDKMILTYEIKCTTYDNDGCISMPSKSGGGGILIGFDYSWDYWDWEDLVNIHLGFLTHDITKTCDALAPTTTRLSCKFLPLLFQIYFWVHTHTSWLTRF